ncbi:MAG TPA: hypothetical protein VFE47_29710 [Tepidisphaeraceae bacterium]|jgi:hypothetical protein|nr:hypothetical protein [Tepidisphaeraceae bacterium]
MEPYDVQPIEIYEGRRLLARLHFVGIDLDAGIWAKFSAELIDISDEQLRRSLDMSADYPPWTLVIMEEAIPITSFLVTYPSTESLIYLKDCRPPRTDTVLGRINLWRRIVGNFFAVRRLRREILEGRYFYEPAEFNMFLWHIVELANRRQSVWVSELLADNARDANGELRSMVVYALENLITKGWEVNRHLVIAVFECGLADPRPGVSRCASEALHRLSSAENKPGRESQSGTLSGP